MPANVTRVIEQPHQRAGSTEYNNLGHSVRHFLVQTINRTDDDTIVLNADDGTKAIPATRSAHPTRFGLYVAKKECRQKGGSRLWEVMVTYGDIASQAPWLEPALYAWGNSPVQVTIDRDIVTGKPIVNSAGQFFDPGVQTTIYLPTLTVTKALQTYSTSVANAYQGRVNSATFKGAAAGYCLCTGITATQAIYTDGASKTLYWNLTYSFAFHWMTHQAVLLDAGYHHKPGDRLVPIVVNGREVSSPWPLDGSGVAIAPTYDPATVTYHWKTFSRFPTADFTALGI